MSDTDRYCVEFPAITIKKQKVVNGEALSVNFFDFKGLTYDNLKYEQLVGIEVVLKNAIDALTELAEASAAEKGGRKGRVQGG